MDETEITNNEYRQFIQWVRDSTAAKLMGYVKNVDGVDYVDWAKAKTIKEDLLAGKDVSETINNLPRDQKRTVMAVVKGELAESPGTKTAVSQNGDGSKDIIMTTKDGGKLLISEDFMGSPKDIVVNGMGWRTAMGTLAFERGASTLGQQMAFRNELDHVIAAARRNGKIDDPVIRQRIAAAVSGLDIMRWNTLRVLSGPDDAARVPPAAMITKLYWATWHRDLGELAMDVLGPEALLGEHDVPPGEGYELTALQRLFLFTRSDTIYAGSNEIQRNIIGERVLGLPKEPA